MTANISIQNQVIYESVISTKTAEKKIQTANCSALSSVLGEMMQMTNTAKGATTQTPVVSNGTANPADCAAMAKMIALLSRLQTLVGKITQVTGDTNGAMLTAMVQLSEENSKSVQAQIKELLEKQQKHNHWSMFEKIFATLAAVIVSVVNPEMLFVTIPLILSTWDPKISLTKGLSEGIQLLSGHKITPAQADVIAGFIVCIAMVMATEGTGAAEEVATVAEEVGGADIEMVNLAPEADQAGEVADQEANSTTSTGTKLKNGLKYVTTGSAALMQSNLINSVAQLSDPSMSENTKDKIALISGVILAVITTLAAIGGMGMTTTSNAAANSSSFSQFIAKATAFIKPLTPSLSSLQKSLFVTTLLQAASQAGGSVIQFQISDLYDQMGATKGMGEMISNLTSLTTTGMNQSTKTQNAVISAHSEAMTQSLSVWEKEYAAIANAMTA